MVGNSNLVFVWAILKFVLVEWVFIVFDLWERISICRYGASILSNKNFHSAQAVSSKQIGASGQTACVSTGGRAQTKSGSLQKNEVQHHSEVGVVSSEPFVICCSPLAVIRYETIPLYELVGSSLKYNVAASFQTNCQEYQVTIRNEKMQYLYAKDGQLRLSNAECRFDNAFIWKVFQYFKNEQLAHTNVLHEATKTYLAVKPIFRNIPNVLMTYFDVYELLESSPTMYALSPLYL